MRLYRIKLVIKKMLQSLVIVLPIVCIVILVVTEKVSDDQDYLEEKEQNQEEDNLKYILLWTIPTRPPLGTIENGQAEFLRRNCSYSNCVITSNRSYLSDYSKFDAILFTGIEVLYCYDLPKRRSPHQKYVFTTIESSDNYPVCSSRFDRFFNWTWTYRLDSEVKWSYFVVRDKNNTVIGPGKDINWIKLDDMDPVNNEFKQRLSKKRKAAAWLIPNCVIKSKKEYFVDSLKAELIKYNLDIDIFGKCQDVQCSDKGSECDKLIKDVYYFYLVFENGFSEDYVTEKLLTALENDAVPIVYGGANYRRFMPDGAYLNAVELGVQNLAAKMNELVNDPNKYLEYFKWKNHYSYHKVYASVETDPYCLFCGMLNNNTVVDNNNRSAYKNFSAWWDPPNLCI